MGKSYAENLLNLPQGCFPFQSRFVEIDGAAVHYVDEGVGPVFVLLHGNPTWSFLYRGLIKHLRSGFRCIALDYPGFGLSTAPQQYNGTPEEHSQIVTAFINKLALPNFTLVMQDWGGPIGLAAVAPVHKKVKGLVLNNTWAWPLNGQPRFELFSRFMGGPLGRLGNRHFNFFVNWLLPWVICHKKMPNEALAAYRAPFLDPDRRIAMNRLAQALLHSHKFLSQAEQALWAFSHVPALIVWGGADPAFCSSERQRLERALANHQTVMLKNAGHLILEEAPEEMAAAINLWRAQVSISRC